MRTRVHIPHLKQAKGPSGFRSRIIPFRFVQITSRVRIPHPASVPSIQGQRTSANKQAHSFFSPRFKYTLSRISIAPRLDSVYIVSVRSFGLFSLDDGLVCPLVRVAIWLGFVVWIWFWMCHCGSFVVRCYDARGWLMNRVVVREGRICF